MYYCFYIKEIQNYHAIVSRWEYQVNSDIKRDETVVKNKIKAGRQFINT